MVPESIRSLLPYFSCGTVVKGFGRGSKQLGCPTANLPNTVVARLPPGFQCGVYFGWASVNSGRVHEMVMSIGYNPHFGNKMKTMETHILHEYAEDFYGSLLKIAVVGFIRDMTSYKNIDDLIEAIESDKQYAKQQLANSPEYATIREHSFFTNGGEQDSFMTEFESPNIGIDCSGTVANATVNGSKAECDNLHNLDKHNYQQDSPEISHHEQNLTGDAAEVDKVRNETNIFSDSTQESILEPEIPCKPVEKRL